jgi:aspartate carbamoyltransferase catalytic subunit
MIQSMNEFFQKDIISIRDLDKQKLELIFDATEKIMKINPKESL